MGWLRNIAARIVGRKLFAGDILRLIGFPFQRLFDKAGTTHEFLIQNALGILDSDGFATLASWYRSQIEHILRGNRWADGAWKNSCHHYDPRRKRGLFLWPSAPDQARIWFRNAQKAWASSDVPRSMFFLGACLHIVQDACQPYHARCVVVDGHQKYERWVDETKARYRVVRDGIYDLGRTVEDWVRKNAEFSYEFFPMVLPGRYGSGHHAVTEVLLSRAQRTSAGFLVFFMEASRESGHEPAEGFYEEVLKWRYPGSLSEGYSPPSGKTSALMTS